MLNADCKITKKDNKNTSLRIYLDGKLIENVNERSSRIVHRRGRTTDGSNVVVKI